MKHLYKIDSSEFNSQYGEPINRDSIKQEMLSVKNNKIVTKTIADSGFEITETLFERQDMETIILSNIEIQFALYQFYVLYSGLENEEDRSTGKLCGEIWYPNAENKLSDTTLFHLLSIFDSLHVVYKKDKTHVQTTLSSLDTKTSIYHTYKRLYKESRLNPIIMSFMDEWKGHRLEVAGNAVYQYRPCEDDIEPIVLDAEEMIFIDFIKQQLTLSNYFMFYCIGWNEDDVARSLILKKLVKPFNKLFFLSTPDRFLSQLLVISNH
ncbi:hypothetical protein [Paenibacillus contaminans]|uniref:Uncharacterized protein n=1 Tax=Paenibacillus contaminans TaxID=450362 RepID=A0A329MK79_9BACL|nr:hypothetical protein [Paenibacillus contaminans]RAV20052.1 hypothetical protein DQG23_16390 [Paenibacillus contaminans]